MQEDQRWWLSTPQLDDGLQRLERIAEIRRRVHLVREGARYWRKRGRVRTAEELERVAAFLDDTLDDLTYASGLRRR